MVGLARPEFVLFGSSIVQFSFDDGGWGATLAHIYARQADVVLRGYAGWNSRNALEVLDQVFPKDAAVPASLVIVYFGGNDSKRPGNPSHVPLPEYVENMRKIAIHLKGLSEKTRLIYLSAPPVNEEMLDSDEGLTNEVRRIYSEALLNLCREMEVKTVDLWTAAIESRPDWLTACFTDGMHFSAEGSEIVAKHILRVIKKADWQPSLRWDLMPIEFPGISHFDDADGIQASIPLKLQWE